MSFSVAAPMAMTNIAAGRRSMVTARRLRCKSFGAAFRQRVIIRHTRHAFRQAVDDVKVLRFTKKLPCRAPRLGFERVAGAGAS